MLNINSSRHQQYQKFKIINGIKRQKLSTNDESIISLSQIKNQRYQTFLIDITQKKRIKQSKRNRCSPPNEFSEMQTVERKDDRDRLMVPALRFMITPVAIFV